MQYFIPIIYSIAACGWAYSRFYYDKKIYIDAGIQKLLGAVCAVFWTLSIVLLLHLGFFHVHVVHMNSMTPHLKDGEIAIFSRLLYWNSLIKRIHTELNLIVPEATDVVLIEEVLNQKYLVKRVWIPENKEFWIGPSGVVSLNQEIARDIERKIPNASIGCKINTLKSTESLCQIKVSFQQISFKQEVVNDWLYTGVCASKFNGIICKVPKGFSIVIGDNINVSLDSRSIGLINNKKIVGNLIAKYTVY